MSGIVSSDFSGLEFRVMAMQADKTQPFNPYMRGVEAMEDLLQDLNVLTVDREKRAEYIQNLLEVRDRLHALRKEELENGPTR